MRSGALFGLLHRTLEIVLYSEPRWPRSARRKSHQAKSKRLKRVSQGTLSTPDTVTHRAKERTHRMPEDAWVPNDVGTEQPDALLVMLA